MKYALLNMMQKQTHQRNSGQPGYKKEGSIHVDYNSKSTNSKNHNSGGEYIDYEIVK